MLLVDCEIEQNLQININQKKTFVFDLDGTIIYNGQPLAIQFEQVLWRIHNAGHQIVFATGRSLRDFMKLLPSWCHEHPKILFGGGLVIDDVVKSQNFLPKLDVIAMIDYLESHQIKYIIDGHRAYYHPDVEHWMYDEIEQTNVVNKAPHVNKIIDSGAYKILVVDDSWIDEFNILAAERELIITHHINDKCFDIMPCDVNKFIGLQYLNLPDYNNIFVFGNDRNDLELMQNLPNSIMFGSHFELSKYAKIQISHGDDLFPNFLKVITTILGE